MKEPILTPAQRRAAGSLIDSTGGRLFGATFLKRDGSVRTGVFRINHSWTPVTDNPRRRRTYMRNEHELVHAVDMGVARREGKENAIRSIPLTRLVHLRVDGRDVDCTRLPAAGRSA